MELHDINNQHSMLVDLEHQQQVGGLDVVPMDLDAESPFPHPPRRVGPMGRRASRWWGPGAVKRWLPAGK